MNALTPIVTATGGSPAIVVLALVGILFLTAVPVAADYALTARP